MLRNIKMQAEEKIDFNRMMTVGEVAKRSGVAVSTLHFYESKEIERASCRERVS